MPIIRDDEVIKIYELAIEEAKGYGLEIDECNSHPGKPWGAYIRIADGSIGAFYHAYWKGMDVPCDSPNPVSPKILLVAPGKRLSLQYHNRRSEVWRVIEGPVGVIRGENLNALIAEEYQKGAVITFRQGELHRLVGLKSWGKIAEIWCHCDPNNPSDENDIVRIEDDYGRNFEE